jgi:hypothetical protein
VSGQGGSSIGGSGSGLQGGSSCGGTSGSGGSSGLGVGGWVSGPWALGRGWGWVAGVAGGQAVLVAGMASEVPLGWGSEGVRLVGAA